MTVLCVDTNIGLDHALAIGGSGEKCYYAIDVHDAFPKLEDVIGGYGFDEITKISDWGNVVDEANVIVFLDSGFGGVINFLRKLGRNVFGADSKSERLELDRIFAREVNKELGIGMADGEVVKGISGVVDYISRVGKKVYVKINKVRGSVETFGTDDANEADVILRQGGFSVIGDAVDFVVEHELGGVEVGVDTFIGKDGFSDVVFETIELKGCGNVSKVVRKEKSIWAETLDKLESWLVANGYRGMFCIEGFYDGEMIRVTDYTPRFPYICSHAYPRWIRNYVDVIKGIASGIDVKLMVNWKYSVQVGIYTDNPSTWRKIVIPVEYEKDVAFRRVVKKDGYWFVPDDYVVAVAVWNGDSLLYALDKAIDIAESIKCSNSYYQGYELKQYVLAVREKLEDLGVVW